MLTDCPKSGPVEINNRLKPSKVLKIFFTALTSARLPCCAEIGSGGEVPQCTEGDTEAIRWLRAM
jgi:hypothetical protein